MKALALLLALSAPLAAAQTDLGGSNALFPLLRAPAGTRSLSLGGAYEAIAQGAEGALYNPAAPAFSPGLELAFHHQSWLSDTYREYLQLSSPVGGRGGMAAHGAYVAYPTIELRDSQGAKLGSAQPNDLSVGLAGAYRPWSTLSFGAGLRALRQELPGLSLRGVSADLGLLARPVEALSLAAVLRSIPTQDSQGQGQSLGGSVAAAYSLGSQRPLTLALSLGLDAQAPTQLRAGLEQRFGSQQGQMALRAGYNTHFSSAERAPGEGLALGTGMVWGRLGLDYACLLYGPLGLTQQLSLTWGPRP